MDILSKRAVRHINFTNFKRIHTIGILANLYSENNKKGIVNLGNSENSLCEDIIRTRLEQPDMSVVEPHTLYYPELRGFFSFREALADFFNRKLNANSFKAENVVVMAGATAGLDILAHCLADPGECFLTPTPMYTCIKTDSGEVGQVNCIEIPMDDVNQVTGQVTYSLTVGKIRKGLEEAKVKGKVVRGLVLINPHNPTGMVFDKQLLQDILNWAAKEKLHVIVDEIYALSVFEGDFTSVATLDMPDPDRTHFIWSFSKDMTLSGIRMGVIHSWSSKVVEALVVSTFFASTSGMVQKNMEILVRDTDWLENDFFPINLRRLKESRDYLSSWLTGMGIPHSRPRAAFFIWADFSQYLEEGDDDMVLFHTFVDAGVYAEPSTQAFYSKSPGFFRILFSIERSMLQLGLTRMENALNKIKAKKVKILDMKSQISSGGIDSTAINNNEQGLTKNYMS